MTTSNGASIVGNHRASLIIYPVYSREKNGSIVELRVFRTHHSPNPIFPARYEVYQDAEQHATLTPRNPPHLTRCYWLVEFIGEFGALLGRSCSCHSSPFEKLLLLLGWMRPLGPSSDHPAKRANTYYCKRNCGPLWFGDKKTCVMTRHGAMDFGN